MQEVEVLVPAVEGHWRRDLYNRTADLLDYLDEHILPKQKTIRKQRLDEAMERVRRLL